MTIFGTEIESNTATSGYPSQWNRTASGGDYTIEQFESAFRAKTGLSSYTLSAHRGGYSTLEANFFLNNNTFRVQRDVDAGRAIAYSHKQTSGTTWAQVGAATSGSIYTNIVNRGNQVAQALASNPNVDIWWSFFHEPNGPESTDSSVSGSTNLTTAINNWHAALQNIYTIWTTTCGVPVYSGLQDGTVLSHGLLLAGPNMSGPAGTTTSTDHLAWYGTPATRPWFWDHIQMVTIDVYPGTGGGYTGSNTVPYRTLPEMLGDLDTGQSRSGLFDWLPARIAAQNARVDATHPNGYICYPSLWEFGALEFTDEDTTTGNPAFGSVSANWPSGLAATRPNWFANAADYLIQPRWGGYPFHSVLYWDDMKSPTGSRGPWMPDTTLASWNAFVDFIQTIEAASPGPPPPPAPVVDAPTVLQSTAVINSPTAAAVYNSAPFNVGPDELLLLWTEAEHGSINPGVPSMSFPTAPTSGTAPTFSRISAGDHPWQSVAVGGVNAAQGLWVASTKTSGPANGCVLRVTFPASLGGCTVVMERIVGADLSGAVAAALVGAPVKAEVVAATSASVTLPAPASTRNRAFAFTSHRQNEPTTPGSFAAKTATLIGNGPGVSITPVAGKLHLAVVYMVDGGGIAPVVNSLTGCNLTWTQVNMAIDTANQGTVALWQGVGSAPTTGTPVITTNLGGGLSFLRAHFIDISNASGFGNMFAGVITAGQGTFSYIQAMTYQQQTSGLLTLGLVSLNTTATLNTQGTTVIPGTGGAQGVTDEVARFEVWKATFDDSRPANPGYVWPLEPSYIFSGLFVEMLAVPPLAEGMDVTRTTPAPIGVATAHSVGAFQTNITESWVTPAVGGLMAVQVAAGPPAAGERLGATSNYISTFETMLGRSVDSQRVSVADTAALVTWGAGGWATAAAADAAGRAVFVSCFLGANTWAQVAAGNANAFLDSLGPNLAAFTQPGVFAYFPEPEDDTGTRGTAAQFRAAATFVINRLRPLMPGWRFANVLNEADWFSTTAFNGTPYFSANGRVAQDWIVPEADILAVNAFNTKGAVQGTHPYADSTKPTYADIPLATWASGWLASGAANAKYLMLSEFGCAVDDPAVNANGHAQRAAWIGSAMTYMKGRVEAVHYADLDSVDGRINMRITGGVKAAEQDSVDAFESGAASSNITKTHTTTAIIRKAATKTHTATAVVRKTIPKTYTSDAVVRRPFGIITTADAVISKSSVTRSHTSDAYITPYVLVSHVTSNSSSGVSSVVVG